MSEVLRKLYDYKHPKLPIAIFFEFMKVAYQVNSNSKNVTTMQSTDNKLDWNKLTKINLNLETQNHKIIDKQCINSDQTHENECSDVIEKMLLETYDVNVKNSAYSIASSNEQIHTYDKTVLHNVEKCNQVAKSSLKVDEAKIARFVDTAENLLMTLMKKNLSEILHEGLLDSVLPYVIPRPILSQPIIKKFIANAEIKKTHSLSNSIEARTITNITHKDREKDRSKTHRKSIE